MSRPPFFPGPTMPTPVPDQDAARLLVRERIIQLALSVKATERLAGLSGGSLHGFLKADAPEGISATTLFALLRALGLRLAAVQGRVPQATREARRPDPPPPPEPTPSKAERDAARKLEILQLRAAGLRLGDIAAKLGLTSQRVQQIAPGKVPLVCDRRKVSKI